MGIANNLSFCRSTPQDPVNLGSRNVQVFEELPVVFRSRTLERTVPSAHILIGQPRGAHNRRPLFFRHVCLLFPQKQEDRFLLFAFRFNLGFQFHEPALQHLRNTAFPVASGSPGCHPASGPRCATRRSAAAAKHPSRCKPDTCPNRAAPASAVRSIRSVR